MTSVVVQPLGPGDTVSVARADDIRVLLLQARALIAAQDARITELEAALCVLEAQRYVITYDYATTAGT